VAVATKEWRGGGDVRQPNFLKSLKKIFLHEACFSFGK
jgi:hypothetical protein